MTLDVRAEHLLRDLAPQVLAIVCRRFHDFSASEDAVQEALLAAALSWPRDGVPENPRAWLIQVAQRRMTDHVRSEIARRNREGILAADTDFVVAPVMPDESSAGPDSDPDGCAAAAIHVLPSGHWTSASAISLTCCAPSAA